MTMSRYHNHDVIESLWSSILFEDAYPECHNSDEEMLKVSLLTQSTVRLFKGLRDHELFLATQLESVTTKWESEIVEKTALQEELLLLRNELQVVESKVRKFKQEAKEAATKCKRLQSQISSEVDARLQAIFKTCLQHNKAATVFDMMTQIHQDTQVAEKDLSTEDKISFNGKEMETDSPDFIQPTPEDNSKKQSFVNKKGEKKSRIELSTDLNQSIKTPKATPPSPDEIADTPIRKKDNATRYKKFSKLMKDEPEQSEDVMIFCDQNEVYAKDTQDLEVSKILRPVHEQNISIPPTLDPDNISEDDDCEDGDSLIEPKSRENEKENGKMLRDSKSNSSRKLAKSSKHSNFPSSPKKEIKERSCSPILGNSSGKKANSRVQYSPAADTPSVYRPPGKKLEAQTKIDSQNKNTVQGPCIVEVGYRVTENKKIRRSAQPNIEMMFAKQSKSKKLSLRKDISKTGEFNGGQRSSVDLALDVSQMSEKQQVEIALKNSMEDKSHSAAEDSDATLFEHNSPLHEEANTTSRAGSVNQQKKMILRSPSMGASSETFFEPGFASTAKEDVFLTGQPYNLVEKDASSNSDLNGLVYEINKLDQTAPYPPETSFDRLPKRSPSPNYAYDGGPVRKKSDRRNLKGVECMKCGEFFEAAFDDPDQKHSAVNYCSRHRSKHGLRSRSPEGFWDMGMPPTQVIRERQGLPSS